MGEPGCRQTLHTEKTIKTWLPTGLVPVVTPRTLDLFNDSLNASWFSPNPWWLSQDNRFVSDP